MSVRVGINGFGRIGRNFVRAVLAQEADIEVVALNDLTSAETNAHLLRYDTTHGRLPVSVSVEGDHMVIGGRAIRVLAEREPGRCPGRSSGRTSSPSRPVASPVGRTPPPTSWAGPSG